jgi:CubicO group peptidase (beta-lactamase class C family)
MRLYVLLAGAAGVVLTGSALCAQSGASIPPTVVSGTQAVAADSVLRALEKEGFSGVVLVVNKGAVVLRKGYGLAVRERKVPFTPGTVVQIGSNTKDFTAVAILQLQEQGKLRVTDSLGRFFPQAPADKRAITLMQLMNHSSGFEPNLAGGDFRTLERDQFLALAFASKLLYAPGQGERYSNLGYSMLAAVIEVVTGDSYGTFLQKNIWQPLHMQWTGLLFPKYDTAAMAHGYNGSQDDGTMLDKPHAKDGPYWNLRGNGGYLSTVDEMYHFYDVLFQTDSLLRPAERDLKFAPNQPMILAGSDMINFFLFNREPMQGMTMVLASNASDFPAPRARDAIAPIFGLPVPNGRRIGKGGGAPVAGAAAITLPDTPAGRRAQEYIAMFNRGDSAAAVPFIISAIQQDPQDQRTPEQRAGNMRTMRGRLGAMTPTSVVSSTATEIVFTVRAENEPSATITMNVEAGAPYRITGMRIMVE